MGNMWNQQIAARQGSYNGLPSTPKPAARVPWTMKADPTPQVKKDSIIYDKDVDDFEKCRSVLKQSKDAPDSKVTPKKPTTTKPTSVQPVDKENKATKEPVVIKDLKEESKEAESKKV